MTGIIKPPLGAQLNFGHPLAQGLVGCWLMNEGCGPIVYDLSGNGNHGTCENMTGTATSGWVPGKFGHALAFDGTNDIVDCGTGSTINSLSEITIITTITTRQLPISYKYFYSICQRDDANNVFSLSLNGDLAGKWQFSLYTNATDPIAYGSVPVLNRCYIMTATYSDSGDRTPYIYENGVDVSVDQVAASGELFLSPTTPILIGNRAVSLARGWNGLIGYTLLFNRAFSPSKVLEHSHEPFAMFDQRRFWAVAATILDVYASLSQGVSLAPTAAADVDGALSLSTSHSMSDVADADIDGMTTLSLSNSLVIEADSIVEAVSALNASSGLSATGDVIVSAQTVLTVSTTISAIATALVEAGIALGAVTLTITSRYVAMDVVTPGNRILTVKFELRTLDIEAEDRVLSILPENRELLIN